MPAVTHIKSSPQGNSFDFGFTPYIFYCYSTTLQHSVTAKPRTTSPLQKSPLMEAQPPISSPSSSMEPPFSSSSSSSLDNQSKWCDLPRDILLRIVRRLNWITDLPRIRSVCPAWRSIVPPSIVPNLNRLLKIPTLPTDDDNDDHDDDDDDDDDDDNNLPLILVQSHFYFLSPLHTDDNNSGALGGRWLARMTDIAPNYQKWHLFNPLNVHDYFFSDPPLVGSLNLLDCRVMELAAPFTLISHNENAKPVSKKVVGGWNFESSYVLAVLVQLESLSVNGGGGLLFWKLGEPEWVCIEGTDDGNGGDEPFRVLDVVFHDGNFYVFELLGWRVGIIDPKCPSKAMEFIDGPDIVGPLVNDSYTVVLHDRSYYLLGAYLVSSNGNLYLVIEAAARSDSDDKKEEKRTVFVFVLKQEEGEKEEGQKSSWEQVDNLGDQIFFIGYDVAFSLPCSSVNLPQWKPNSICLFTRPFPLLFDGFIKGQKAPKGTECLDMLTYADYWRYYRVFEMEGGEEKGVVRFEELSKEVYTGLFFPPPAWVQWRCPSLDNVVVELAGVKFRGDDEDESNP